MDTLLAEALQDFEDEGPPTASSQEQPAPVAPLHQVPDDPRDSARAASGATCQAPGTSSASPCDEGTSAGSSRGPSLPSRGPALPGPSKTGKALAFDPLKKQPSPAPSPGQQQQQQQVSRPGGPGLPQLPAHTQQPKASDTSLPPQVQKLAEDLMRLMEESGLDLEGTAAEGSAGLGEGPLEGLDASEFGSAALRALVERATHAAEEEATAATSSGSRAGGGAGGEEGAGPGFSSAVLRGLAEQTKSTVEQQAGVSRGEGKGTAAAPRDPGAGAGAGQGGLPFGNLLGMLGGMGGAGAGLGLGGQEGEGEGGGMGFMADYIMQNLLSKEVLYAPLKDIRDKYPPWLEASKAQLSAGDMQRYQAQYASIQAVCKQYEEDPTNFKRLVDLIQEMQTYGDPPSAIVDEMTGGMPDDLLGASHAADDNTGMPDLADLPQELKDKCPIQ